MLSFVYCVDKNGVLGYSYDIPGTETEGFAQPIISKKDRIFFKDQVKNSIILMGGNTLRSLITEGANLPKTSTNRYAVFTTDAELIEFARNKWSTAFISHLMNPEQLLSFVEDLKDENVACIGGQHLFEWLNDKADRHLVTEFDIQADVSSPEVTWVYEFDPPMSISGRENYPGWEMKIIKQFEDVDQNGNPISGSFLEFTRKC